MADQNKFERKDDVFSKAVRAGKRTYFFDVKATKNDEHFLTITESKRVFNDDGKFSYEKHKIFLYREDFDKFQEGLAEALDFIRNNSTEDDTKDFSDVDFEDLNTK